MIYLPFAGLQYYDFEGSYALSFVVDGYKEFWAHENYKSLTEKASEFPIMQFTGITLKDGTEVYEGDYFQVAKNKIYEVRWMDQAESNHETYAAAFVLWLNDKTFFPFDEWALDNGEVVGNIYENLKP